MIGVDHGEVIISLSRTYRDLLVIVDSRNWSPSCAPRRLQGAPTAQGPDFARRSLVRVEQSPYSYPLRPSPYGIAAELPRYWRRELQELTILRAVENGAIGEASRVVDSHHVTT